MRDNKNAHEQTKREAPKWFQCPAFTAGGCMAKHGSYESARKCRAGKVRVAQEYT